MDRGFEFPLYGARFFKFSVPLFPFFLFFFFSGGGEGFLEIFIIIIFPLLGVLSRDLNECDEILVNVYDAMIMPHYIFLNSTKVGRWNLLNPYLLIIKR